MDMAAILHGLLKIVNKFNTIDFSGRTGSVGAAISPPEAATPYFARMGLDQPGDLKQAAIQILIVAGLRDSGHV
jgi:hypothetical protein